MLKVTYVGFGGDLWNIPVTKMKAEKCILI